MKYAQPSILLSVPAINTIQGFVKSGPLVDNQIHPELPNDTRPTSAAYEADE